MRISVALCTYNGERFLDQQLASIAAQSRHPDELVVSDDGSTDGSIEMIERFASTAGFLVRLQQNATNLGVTRNFEQTMGLCDGDLIVTADQDDVWIPEKLARIAAEFDRSPGVGLVFSDADLIDGAGRPIGSRLWPSVRFGNSARRDLDLRDPFDVLLRRPVITGASMAFRSDLRNLVRPIPPPWLHDEWIGLMVSSVARIVAIAEPLMQYRVHATNQVGVLGVDRAARAKTSIGRARSEFLAKADDFAILREALASRLPDRADLLAKIDQKIAHFRARGRLPRSRLARLPGILGELTTQRYSRYSGSWLGAARDLLAKE
jgi:glycosyltransferase involved in cell wall biosynthesis